MAGRPARASTATTELASTRVGAGDTSPAPEEPDAAGFALDSWAQGATLVQPVGDYGATRRLSPRDEDGDSDQEPASSRSVLARMGFPLALDARPRGTFSVQAVERLGRSR